MVLPSDKLFMTGPEVTLDTSHLSITANYLPRFSSTSKDAVNPFIFTSSVAILSKDQTPYTTTASWLLPTSKPFSLLSKSQNGISETQN